MQNEGNGPWKQRPGLYYWWESNRKCSGEAKSGEALVCGSWRPAPRAVWNSQGIQAVSTHPQPAEGAGPSSGFGCEVSANSHLPLSTGKTDVTHQPCGFSCACTSFKLSLCSDCAVCHSTVTLEKCATVAGEGWLPGKIWELCALLVYCKGKVKQVRFFSTSETHLTLQYKKLKTCTWPVTASAMRHFSTRCGSIFSPL